MSDTTTQPSEPAALPLGHMDALPPGTMLGEFELQALLGVGGFGMVYRGYDHSLHRPVAIKEYMPSALVGRGTDLLVSARSTADAKPFQAGLQSFIAEARLLARFDHPSLVKVYRFWEANNTAYMAMPLYEGITLKEARRRMSGPPSEEWLRQVLWSVLEALRVLHDNDTLHRDVSPDNIFLQNLGPPVLLDLGAARRALMDSSQKHTAILKVNYAPIEQYADAHDLREGPWTDLYALAAVVHGCLCNEPPLPATFRVVRDRMPAFAQVAKTAETHFGQLYSLAFVEAVAHALTIEPAGRPQSVDAFAQEMALQVPADMARFDWHQGLGPSITLEERGVASVPLTTALLTTQPAPQQHTQPVTSKTSRASAKTVRVPPRAKHKPDVVAAIAPRKTAPSGWWIAAVVALVVGVLAAAVTVGIGHKPTPQAAIVEPEKSATPAEIVPVTEVPVPAAGPNVAASAPRNASAALAKPATAAVAGVAADKPVVVKPNRAEPKPSSAPSAPPVVQVAPVELCPDATVLTKTMCVYRECLKPEHAQLPVCIADRKRWESQNNRAVLP
ncbi:protein kinase domain-containing protein [Rhodoferax saidenbachensis]|uniref:Non-specific serine/threonine protein kinase n=1 Tax=Rhodoferax saidenbachensis TaxID=1484693 RepID=A0ABU1ZRD5_9BURK|nr:protein kinase [Rhodoferax saidenbachensis]MDR7308120.1 non-specific serine/threonine protein kinase [Rhodoferax saidenbachensis]